MKLRGYCWALGLGALLIILSTVGARAFSLLGPVQPWMQASNGVYFPGDLGGPMARGKGYRWNVPMVTYGFDQSFLDYFGTNGVVAVEAAIKVLNDLPTAAALNITNYPLLAASYHSTAGAQSLLDLKSYALAQLVHQSGLADPSRYVYVLHDLDASFASNSFPLTVEGMPVFYEKVGAYSGVPLLGGKDVTNYIAGYHFDPTTLQPSAYLNNILFGASIYYSPSYPSSVVELFSVDPLAQTYAPVAGFDMARAGIYYTNLTRDDAGGWRYLYASNNIQFEILLSDIRGVGTNIPVNGAMRSGVDKLTFVRQAVGTNLSIFLPMTNQFTDTYISNSVVVHQPLVRVTQQPDILFSATYDGFQSGTTNWLNLAASNGLSGGDGPGIIRPPTVIAFPKTGEYQAGSGDVATDYTSGLWSSFDGSTNVPGRYPIAHTNVVSMRFRLLLQQVKYDDWQPASLGGTVYVLQTSTNLSTWTTLFQVTNVGSAVTYQNDSANEVGRFYRLITP